MSPVKVVSAYLSRIDTRNPVVNAYTCVLAAIRAYPAVRAARRGATRWCAPNE
jgi:Asp-tRNA(Asn)/Glu-tRNA(Gln) amidotransferase A subunit family amidase